MGYSERIKSFDRIREYMRSFYVYGFKSRDEYDIKSARAYDNERRRIESWLGDLMGFRRDAEGKRVFLSVDSLFVAHNPLHKAFKAKSFTRNDITLHFILLDILQEGESLTAPQIVDRIAEYFSKFVGAGMPDESTVRKKLSEYAQLGVVSAQSLGKARYFSRSRDGIDLRAWADAIAFYSEVDCLGVVGGYLLDRLDVTPDWFRFKHHYLLRVLESELLLSALTAIRERRNARLLAAPQGAKARLGWIVTPVKVLASTQTGRYYLCAYDPRRKRLVCYRMDHLVAIEPLGEEPDFSARAARFHPVKQHLWGAGLSGNRSVTHVEVTVRAGHGEAYIAQRLLRERRCGSVEQVDEDLWRFSADVYDPYELGPWVRTFIGRIVEFRCGDAEVVSRFQRDVRAALAMYGEGNAI